MEIKIIYLLILFLLFINIVKSFRLVQDISISPKELYGDPNCTFDGILRVELEDESEYLTFIVEGSANNLQYTNKKHLVFQFSFQLLPKDSNNIIQVYKVGVSNISHSEHYNFNYICDKPPKPTSIISYGFKNNIFYIDGDFKVNNFIRANLPALEIVNNPFSSIGNYFNMFYSIRVNNLQSINSTYEFELKFTNYPSIGTFKVKLDGPFSNYRPINKYRVLNKKRYPSIDSVKQLSLISRVSYQIGLSVDTGSNDEDDDYFLGLTYIYVGDGSINQLSQSKIISKTKDECYWLSTKNSIRIDTVLGLWNDKYFINIENVTSPIYSDAITNRDSITAFSTSSNLASYGLNKYNKMVISSSSFNSSDLGFLTKIVDKNFRVYGSFWISYPFGLEILTSTLYSVKYDTFCSALINTTSPMTIYLNNEAFPSFVQDSTIDETSPTVSSFQIKSLNNGQFEISANITETGGSGFLYIVPSSDMSNILLSKSDIVSGDINGEGYYKSIYQITSGNFAKFSTNNVFYAFDSALNKFEIPLVCDSSEPLTPTLPLISKVPIKISKFYFKIPSMDLTGKGGYNSAYLSISGLEDKSLLFYTPALVLKVQHLNSNIHFNKPIIFYWNYQLKLFQCDFYVPANLPSGEIDYYITFNFMVTGNTKLMFDSSKIKSFFPDLNVILYAYSKYGYSMPPIFSKIESNTTYPSFYQQGGSWDFTLNDTVNGFDFAYITISSVSDKYGKNVYNFSIDSVQNNSFNIKIQTLTCVPDKETVYEIVYAKLFDKEGYYSLFSKYEKYEEIIQYVDPFMQLYENTSTGIGSITISSCSNVPSGTLETLVDLNSFLISRNSINPFSNDREILIRFSVTPDTQLAIDYVIQPIVYLSGSPYEERLSAKANLVEISSPYIYTANITLPYGYSYPFPLIVSIWGVVNSIGSVFGFSGDTIGKSYNNIIKTEYVNQDIIIIGSSKLIAFSQATQELFIYGRNFKSELVLYTMQGQETLYSEKSYRFIDNTTISIQINYSAQPLQQIRLYLANAFITSNSFLVTPILTNNYVSEYIEPSLTNAPQKCLGSPICGGPKQGYCSDKGCICYSPWIGESCQSKVITIPPPTSNPNEPSSNLTFINEQEKSTMIGIISIRSLRELDLNGKVIKTYFFNQWNYKEINQNENYYQYNIVDDSNSNICTISVETIFYEEFSNITFANQQLVMNPSTLKYNINITSYPFDSKLNTLQLIMSASFNSTNQDSCSDISKEFGETGTNENSNYLTLQFNQHSLYGRFIKRGMIDSRILPIGNSVLENLHLENSNYSSTTNHLAISIPNFQYLAQIDPDWSVLLNNNIDNSKCKNNDGGISKGALIGVIVGCVGGAILITISILLIVKYKYHLKNIKNNIKLKQFNQN